MRARRVEMREVGRAEGPVRGERVAQTPHGPVIGTRGEEGPARPGASATNAEALVPAGALIGVIRARVVMGVT